tara:strand:- start:109 stop:366 length:258 start_codon:yes stop_codon:yes gene_type:complete
MTLKPETTVYVSIKEYNFKTRELKGFAEASEFQWSFTWSFTLGKLFVNPPLGRALIEDSLLRFLIKKDYQLESGGDYKFTVSSKF